MVQSFPRGLKITAVAGKDLANKKRFGTQDPYLSFFIQKLTKYTAVAVKGGVNPSWNHTKTFHEIHDGTQEETTLKISCYHEQTGAKGGLIGTCDVDLKQVLFSSDAGLYDGWLQLSNDGVKSGQVHLRLWLCDPIPAPDTSEMSPHREATASKTRSILRRSDKKQSPAKTGKKLNRLQQLRSSFAKSRSASQPTTIRALNISHPTIGDPPVNTSDFTRSPLNRLHRPRSMADLKERKRTIRFADSPDRRTMSRSMEDVRVFIPANSSSEEEDDYSDDNDDYDDDDEDDEDDEDEDADYDDYEDDEDDEENDVHDSLNRKHEVEGVDGDVGSPKQTFILQDSDGNINPLRYLVAPFDPNWLEPTPQILKRALAAQFYYDDLKIQQRSNGRDLFPRPAGGYPGDSLYTGGGHLPASFQASGQGAGSGQPQPPPRPERPLSIPMPVAENYIPPRQPQQIQQQPQQTQQTQSQNYPQQSQGLGPGAASPVTSAPMPLPTQMPSPPPKNPMPPIQSPSVPYQPHTVFQPRNAPKSRMPELNGNTKYSTLPNTRYQMNTGASSSQSAQTLTIPQTQGSMMAAAIALSHPTAPQNSIPVTASSLGPASGYLPDTYSHEHQRTLSEQLSLLTSPPPPSAAVIATMLASAMTPKLGDQEPSRTNSFKPPFTQESSRTNSYKMPADQETSRPSNFKMQADQEPSRPSNFKMPGALPEMDRPGTRNYFYPNQGHVIAPSSPLGQGVFYASPMSQEQQLPYSGATGRQKPPSRVAQSSRPTSALSYNDSFSTLVRSPAAPIPARIPAAAKEPIFTQYSPRALPCEGRDIQESLPDQTIGRRIMSRYTIGLSREKYVREGMYVKDKSPSFTNRQQRGSTQRQSSMDKEANDKVILKYIKARREWEVDCAMMRYLTCHRPEEKLDSQYTDYPQLQQHSKSVSPFVVGLYETFFHPHGTDRDGGCRYLSILQWYPETLQGYINERSASSISLEVTLPIIRSMIESVAWIHSRKICHLNIKPSNFVRDPYSTSTMRQNSGSGWKLIDFEAARVIEEEVVGRCTFSYAAPEILIANSTMKGVYAKGSQDVWSLGLVIYELLTDRPLFPTDEKAKDALVPNARRPLKPVRYYNHLNVLPAYIPLLDAMLTHDPNQRATALQLLQMDIFTTPITDNPVRTDELVVNNNIQTYRDLKMARLCNLRNGGLGSTYMDGNGGGSNYNSSTGSLDSFYSSPSTTQQQQMLMEGVSRILDSQFDQVPRLFMLLPPMAHDLDPSRPFQPSKIMDNKSLRLVLLCEGLTGFGEDAHFTDHRGYVLEDSASFVRDLGKMLLHLVAVASGPYDNPGPEQPLIKTGTSLDNCQRWYPSLRMYCEMLQSSLQKEVGHPPTMNELLAMRGPKLRQLEAWLVRLVRQQSQTPGNTPPSGGSNTRGQMKRVSMVAASDTMNHAGLSLGGTGYDDLSDHLAALNFQLEPLSPTAGNPDVPEVTGPGGGEGFGGLYKMPVGTCGDRWICRGCVSKQMSLVSAVLVASGLESRRT
ncbi:hypothetical protein EMPS_08764 [Entomortierella parvispora]|uniref:Protein kinase domain-containing protein n=1 Tax=Entomortierella parvispora TaxID=205924 RepID=A0A9P3LZY3_9FUNG|nr:hypothetical protein EMPS_08764 [Entomortierella parvispora]